MPALTKEMVPEVVKTGGSTRIAEDVKPRFKPGDRIRAKNMNPASHTRLPRYVRGKIGTVVVDHGVFVTPDTSAHGKGPNPQHVYNVSFDAVELWGPNSASKDKVHIDLWDDYLERA
ncbi:SH3-like domain-containing protein [Mesorhizobium argentiipisi]|uniref:SH3-like domain-containing protein n=1 Tax=Mesorhizobium argentiipisi TaxID=3015175 RepID=UPI00301C09F5